MCDGERMARSICPSHNSSPPVKHHLVSTNTPYPIYAFCTNIVRDAFPCGHAHTVPSRLIGVEAICRMMAYPQTYEPLDYSNVPVTWKTEAAVTLASLVGHDMVVRMNGHLGDDHIDEPRKAGVSDLRQSYGSTSLDVTPHVRNTNGPYDLHLTHTKSLGSLTLVRRCHTHRIAGTYI